MKYFLILAILLASYTASAQDIGGQYYVAPDGDDSYPGTYNKPFGTFQKAFLEAEPGDTVYFRGGIYYSFQSNIINPEAWPNPKGMSGTRDKPIHYFGYPGEWPILDCILHCEHIENPYGNVYNTAIGLNNVEYIFFKDIEIRNVLQCDSVITGAVGASSVANLTFEHIIMHSVGQRGYWITGGAWGTFTQDPAPIFSYDTTRWINCDVYDLCDTLARAPGNAADAWKTIHYGNNVLIWEGCRAWNYSDDGWDPTPIDGAQRILNNCWAMASNKYANLSRGWDTERNAFKLNNPEAYDVVSIAMTNCLAIFSSYGFYEIGGHPSNGIYYNNTSFKNRIGFAGTSSSNGIYRNNIVYGSTGLDPGIKQPYEVAIQGAPYTESHNTWDKVSNYPSFVMTDSVTLTAGDFLTTDSLDLVQLFTSPRNADGSLPPFPLQLAPNSDLIDAGIDVGLPYNGIAPEIGASEYDASASMENQYPAVTIVSPTYGSIFKGVEEIAIITEPIDPDGSISKVEFFSEGIKIGQTSTPPWSFVWKSPPLGTYMLRATATDNENASSTSAQVSISIGRDIDSIELDMIFPNPNDGMFTITLSKPLQSTGEINIVSLEGKVVFIDTINKEELIKEFDLSDIRPGFYLLAITDNENYYWSKFMKY